LFLKRSAACPFAVRTAAKPNAEGIDGKSAYRMFLSAIFQLS
jgi:hypothetical protein